MDSVELEKIVALMMGQEAEWEEKQ